MGKRRKKSRLAKKTNWRAKRAERPIFFPFDPGVLPFSPTAEPGPRLPGHQSQGYKSELPDHSLTKSESRVLSTSVYIFCVKFSQENGIDPHVQSLSFHALSFFQA